jgi:hypothetical protein
MNKLVDEARLSHAGLANHGKYLAAPDRRLLYKPLEDFNLGLPSYKRRESAANRSMKTFASGGSAH